MTMQETLNGYKVYLEEYLDRLPMAGAPDKLREAMRYSLLNVSVIFRSIKLTVLSSIFFSILLPI